MKKMDIWIINVIVPSEVNISFIKKCLRATRIESCFKFNFKQGSDYAILPWGDDRWPWPKNDYEVLIFMKEYNLPGCIFGKETERVVGASMGWKTSIMVRVVDTNIEIGARIMHEIIHSYGINADGLYSTEKDAFKAWMQKTNSKYKALYDQPSLFVGKEQEILCEFYLFLLEENFDIPWWTKLLCHFRRWF